MKKNGLHKFIYLTALFAISSSIDLAYSQNYTTKIDSIIYNRDFGWASFSFNRTQSNFIDDILISLGLHFKPAILGYTDTPYFFELLAVALPLSPESINSIGIGYTKSSVMGRTKFSLGLSNFKSSNYEPIIIANGLGAYISGSLYLEPYLPFGAGVNTEIYFHSKQVLILVGISAILDFAKWNYT